MNRRDRRRIEKAGGKAKKEPTLNLKPGQIVDTALKANEDLMLHEIRQQCLEFDKGIKLDLDTMVLWTLYKCYGWGPKRLKDFFMKLDEEHRRMREFYETDELYPGRMKLKEKGVDIEAWNAELDAMGEEERRVTNS